MSDLAASALTVAGIEPRVAADFAGLSHVSDDKPGIRRVVIGRGFRYKRGSAFVRDAAQLKRIKSLAIPPAWSDVWICASSSGHIQATGRDIKGRKQYLYHPRFRELRESTKYHRMLAFAATLPVIRKSVQAHRALRGLPRE